MGRIVQETVLDAGPRGGGVTAAEWDPIHQISAIYVTPHATVSEKWNRQKRKTMYDAIIGINFLVLLSLIL